MKRLNSRTESAICWAGSSPSSTSSEAPRLWTSLRSSSASPASRRRLAVLTLMRGFVVSALVVRDLAMRVEEISHEGSFRNGRRERQGNREGRAGTRGAGDIDMATHRVDQLADQPQPDAE